ncbi:MAG: cyclic nucleotide-binding domain-containing protein [Proteobacteria bacterium]|nr:cyclic nucleotide-binding domain-containing protein [Ramlibacter sp.]MCA0214164.1 cyclic nucleotide-binding domain-containing protein [Pseudomonadota bacterium]
MESIITEKRAWSRSEVAELLISRTALTELNLEAALQIVRLLTPQRIKAGTVLIHEGVTSTGYMALVLQGEAVVENEMSGPLHDSMVLSMLTSGSLFGELGVLDGKPRSATVTAITDMDIAVLDRPAMARLIETVPAVACALMGAIMARVAERLRATNLKVKSLTALNLSLQDELATLRAGKPAVDVDIGGQA